jgi:hypothetical protein
MKEHNLHETGAFDWQMSFPNKDLGQNALEKVWT